MKRAILQQVLDDQAAGRAVVLCTRLSDGEQRLMYPLEGEMDDVWGGSEALAVLHDDRGRTVETSEGEIFLRPYNPAPRIIVIGAVHIAQALVRMAELAGFRVVVVDPREAFATEARFDAVEVIRAWPDEALERLGIDHRTALVALTHDPKLDDPALQFILRTDAFYVGALGGRKSHGARLDRLREAGFDDDAVGRIRGPVGLPIGARTPEEIAVSILAQVIEALRVPAA